jgi:preprotein translocase subunit SecD
MGTIMDANMTHILSRASHVPSSASGPVRGFAWTLSSAF